MLRSMGNAIYFLPYPRLAQLWFNTCLCSVSGIMCELGFYCFSIMLPGSTSASPTKTTTSSFQFHLLYRARNNSPQADCTYHFHLIFSVIDPCLEPFLVNGSSVLRDSGVCGEHGTCESLSAGKYECKCDKDYTGNHCHNSKYVLCLIEG